jgi:cell division inhibitor SulA
MCAVEFSAPCTARQVGNPEVDVRPLVEWFRPPQRRVQPDRWANPEGVTGSLVSRVLREAAVRDCTLPGAALTAMQPMMSMLSNHARWSGALQWCCSSMRAWVQLAVVWTELNARQMQLHLHLTIHDLCASTQMAVL